MTASLVLGAALVAYGVLWSLGLAPGSQVTLPEPVALQRAGGVRDVEIAAGPLARPAPTPRTTALLADVSTVAPTDTPTTTALAAAPPTAAVAATPAPTTAAPTTGALVADLPPAAPMAEPTTDVLATDPPAVAPTTAPTLAPTPLPTATDAPILTATDIPAPAVAAPTSAPAIAPTSGAVALADDGAVAPADGGGAAPTNSDAANSPQPGYATRLTIPSIHLDTPVEQAGLVQDADGDWTWETRPFVAVHYGDLTALVGAPGNAVIAGHVSTLYEGNVFQSLYQVNLGDTIQVYDDQGQIQPWIITRIQLVAPSDTSVMDPTPDPTLTLITCGGTFDPITREFSDRLIVVAAPAPLAAAADN